MASINITVVSNEDLVLQPEISGFYPNPSHGLSRLKYSVKSPSELEIFNLKGQKVMAYQLSGSGELEFSGCDAWGQKLPSGVYFYRIYAEGGFTVRKLLLLR